MFNSMCYLPFLCICLLNLLAISFYKLFLELFFFSVLSGGRSAHLFYVTADLHKVNSVELCCFIITSNWLLL